jgi:hypothetical protein
MPKMPQDLHGVAQDAGRAPGPTTDWVVSPDALAFDDASVAIEEAGFMIERLERFPFAATRLAPALPHILGLARRPAQPRSRSLGRGA